jgi:FlgD Ig-like domain
VTLLGLLIATAAAFAVTERLKLVKSPITGPHISKVFSPTCGCARGKANVSLRLRHSDRITLTVLDSHRDVVRTLAADLHVPRGRSVFRWDGTTDAGKRASDGAYRVQIHLEGQHRTILLPNLVELDTTAPQVEDATANRLQFSPDGDHLADSVSIRYALSKPAHALVYLDGQRIIRSRSHKPRGAVVWGGRLEGAVLPPGRVTLTLGAVDLAGNATPAADRARVDVEIRYIALASHRISGVSRRARFDIGVSTDARRYTWRLGAREGVAAGPVLRLRAPKKRGSYTLTVAEQGHVDQAVVVVG